MLKTSGWRTFKKVVYKLFHVIMGICVDVVIMFHVTQCYVACRDAGNDKTSCNSFHGRAGIEHWINLEELVRYLFMEIYITLYYITNFFSENVLKILTFNSLVCGLHFINFSYYYYHHHHLLYARYLYSYSWDKLRP